jgi:hypothetical protein
MVGILKFDCACLSSDINCNLGPHSFSLHIS